MKKILLGLFIVSLFLTGCDTEPTTNTTDNTSVKETTEVAGAQDLCTLLPEEEISDILGYTVTAEKGMLPNTKTSSGCGYYSDTAGGVTILYNLDNDFQTAKSQYNQAVSFQEADPGEVIIEDPSGVGESAYIWTNSNTTLLNAYEGNTWLTITIIDDSEERVNHAKKLANLVFSKLNQ